MELVLYTNAFLETVSFNSISPFNRRFKFLCNDPLRLSFYSLYKHLSSYMNMTPIPTLATLAYVNAVLAFLHPVRDLRTSFDGCANSGCSEAGSTGKSCFRIVGTIEDYDDWNDSPQNEKEVRDCICGSGYWVQLAQ